MNIVKPTKELKKLLEKHFELKELKDCEWRLEQIENLFDKALDEQKDKIVEMIDEFQKEYKDMWTNVDYHNDFNKLLKKIKEL